MTDHKRTVDQIVAAHAAYTATLSGVVAAAKAKDGSLDEVRGQSKALFQTYNASLDAAIAEKGMGMRLALLKRAITALSKGERGLAGDLFNAARGRRKY